MNKIPYLTTEDVSLTKSGIVAKRQTSHGQIEFEKDQVKGTTINLYKVSTPFKTKYSGSSLERALKAFNE